jgi:hypothetical protein
MKTISLTAGGVERPLRSSVSAQGGGQFPDENLVRSYRHDDIDTRMALTLDE